eukprot:6866010-Prymnesium_polylepis.2
MVMEDLFWTDTPMLQTISRGEGLPIEQRERFNAVLQTALPPMDEYLALYEVYTEEVQLNIEEVRARAHVRTRATVAPRPKSGRARRHAHKGTASAHADGRVFARCGSF